MPLEPRRSRKDIIVTMTRLAVVPALCTILVAGAVSAARAQATANPFTDIVKNSWTSVKKNVTDAATQMPENEYSFKPTPEVRSFGQIVGHLANDHFLICSAAKGEKNPNGTDFEKTTAKADLLKALADSATYCDGAFAAMTDAKANESVDLFGNKFKRLGALTLNVTHDNEHYGNFVTYMRLKGHVPPTSAGTR
jgi:uncharacterized damage-inducible protein DinB